MGTTNFGAIELEDGGIGGATGTPITGMKVFSQTITPAATAAATAAEQTFTVTGLAVGDKVFVNPGAIANSVGVAHCRVSAANTLAVMFVNPTAGSLTATATTWNIFVIRT